MQGSGKGGKYLRSPIRYPGGKTRGVKHILKYFPPDIQRVCSPFLGGGSVELVLAGKGIEVFGYDVFEPLVSFWQVLLKKPEIIATRVGQYYPLTSKGFRDLQMNYHTIQNKEERAAVFFALNRASFSGTTFSGGMSPRHPRFTIASIERLRNFSAPNLHVSLGDFKAVLPKHADDWLYLDPPYLLSSRLYGNNGDLHTEFDHKALAEILHSRSKWILSYNDCKEIRKLYAGYRMISLQWSYGMNKSKKSSELLILSHDVPLQGTIPHLFVSLLLTILNATIFL